MTEVSNSSEQCTYRRSSWFDSLICESPVMKDILHEIEIVAPTDSTVLVIGETGTGKELVAEAIRERSPRRAGPFVALNCAAIPPTLLESELFGHEKGTFTGAHARRSGRFEQAHGGTMFFDEVGELPLDVQPRLLRALQQRSFERLGGQSTVQVDVRLIAATNRDLKAMCDARTFREDLYYRLNVFPIFLPPLRERREDIPLLAQRFLQEFAEQMGKDVRTISSATMAQISSYDWPGNVRELRNVIERAVIFSSGPELNIDFRSKSMRGLERRPSIVFEPDTAARLLAEDEHVGSLAEVNRAHIIATLRSTNGIVAGPNGAAARLGLKRSTLLFRMKKLGIQCSGSQRSFAHAPG